MAVTSIRYITYVHVEVCPFLCSPSSLIRLIHNGELLSVAVPVE